jgi:hypothetical protein
MKSIPAAARQQETVWIGCAAGYVARADDLDVSGERLDIRFPNGNEDPLDEPAGDEQRGHAEGDRRKSNRQPDPVPAEVAHDQPEHCHGGAAPLAACRPILQAGGPIPPAGCKGDPRRGKVHYDGPFTRRNPLQPPGSLFGSINVKYLIDIFKFAGSDLAFNVALSCTSAKSSTTHI